MEIDDYLGVIAVEAARMAAIAEETSLDAHTPTCPTWNLRQLLLHTGEVHRWATAVVAGRHTSLANVPNDTLGPLPNDNGMVAWFRDGAAKLLETLASADPSVDYDTFLNDPPIPRLLFWARRQAMEICIHRVDAESAVGRCTPCPPKVAADGIDEFLTGFITRGKGAVHRDTPHTIGVVLVDAAQRWAVTIGDGPITTERSVAETDCTITGSASDVFMGLWNRATLDDDAITGDRSLIADLGANVRIRWN
ncbi:MAG: maleylpyruvate isomerase family mycothiol-dependent enzyme [Actinobacteria bacterium]|nr:maleylpyruvate isomerase family mycothiol-dependent enzyme [Actinomycetota bacterium]